MDLTPKMHEAHRSHVQRNPRSAGAVHKNPLGTIEDGGERLNTRRINPRYGVDKFAGHEFHRLSRSCPAPQATAV